MAFEDYFSFDAIFGDLIRWRISGRDVGGTLPARKAWCRDGVYERKGAAPAMVRQRAIWRTVNRLRKTGGLSGCRWGQALLNLVENVRSRIASTDLMFEKPRMIDIAKGYKSGKPEYQRNEDHFVVYSVCKACEDKVIDYGRAGYADLEETVMVL